jgi:serpin B
MQEDTMSKHLRSCALLVSAALVTAAGCTRPGTEPEGAPRPDEIATPEEPMPPASGTTTTPTPEPPKPDSGPVKTAAEAAADNNALGIDLYKRALQGKENVFLSPHSISVALAMTYAGARGDTAAQMSESLHFEVPPERLHPGFQALNQTIRPAAEAGYQLSVANALWGMKGHAFQPAFLEVLRTSYEAPLQEVNFADSEAARTTINDWVARATNDKIKDLIPPGVIDGLTRLVLTNAIYFKGDWAAKFDAKDTKPLPFKVLQGKPVKTPLMHQTAEFGYRETDDAQVLSLPYKGEALSMIVVLPRKTDGLPELEAKLDAETLKGYVEGLEQRKVSVFLPRFKLEASFSLSGELAALGMKDAFDPDRADFSAMDGTRDLFVKEVIHKAFVEVNEEGTEAAAATGVVVGVRSLPAPPPELRADHPFLFFIRHEATGSVLFIGRLARPGA